MESLKKLSVWIACCGLLYSCGPEKTSDAKPAGVESPPKVTPSLHYSVVATYPHDTTAYTEGFLFHKGVLYESTGAASHIPQTRSAIGVVDLKTGKFKTKAEIDKEKYFGEGIVILNDKVYQLTYQTQVGFIYDLKTFDSVGQFGYINKEGWGMTTDGRSLIFSDGSCNLTYMDPNNFQVIKTVPVLENGYGVYMINELEYINGFIYANIWTTSRIIKINPATGEVVAQIDLSQLVNKITSKNRNLTELNGIAYDSLTDKILITGKLWPSIFEITFQH